ncbi:transposase [Limnoglobus roseus]|uniref:Transposase n=1 Tax=Limnoglobus roseus TaxID=2598579 RepID=A0A5C1ADR7_9BACT|nr:transposase [Limnoglobus roseus]
MVADAVATELPFKWVTGDSVYGVSPTFCQGVRALGKWYVLDSSSDARVWTTEPEVIPAGRKPPGKGRPTTNPKPATKPERVADVAAALPASAWRRRTVAEGSQGPRVFDYAELTVWFSEDGLRLLGGDNCYALLICSPEPDQERLESTPQRLRRRPRRALAPEFPSFEIAVLRRYAGVQADS